MRPQDHPIRHALDSLDGLALRRALAQAPAHWHEEVLADDQMCWSPALLNEAAAIFIPDLVTAGLPVNAPIRRDVQVQQPLGVALAQHNLPAAHALLDAGASAHATVTYVSTPVSALWGATRYWDVKSDQPQAEGWLRLIERLRALGAPVVPSTLQAWMRTAGARHARDPALAKRFRALIASAWDQGMRPYDDKEDVHGVSAPLFLMLHAPDEQTRAWLGDVLTPASLPWVGSFLLKALGAYPQLPGFEEAFTALKASGPVEWSPEVVAHWQAVWHVSQHSVHNASTLQHQANVRVDLLEWALDHGLPPHAMVDSAAPLLPYLMGVEVLCFLDNPQQSMRVMRMAFENEEAILEGQPLGDDLVDRIMRLSPQRRPQGGVSFSLAQAQTFWTDHATALRDLRLQVRHARLDECWAPKASAGTKPRF